MRKLSEIKGEEALDVLADILEPAAEIMTDKEFVKSVREKQVMKAVKAALKNHKRSVIVILAILEGENPDTYAPGLVALPLKLIELLNDPDMIQVFYSQGETVDGTSSGSATENTGETATE